MKLFQTVQNYFRLVGYIRNHEGFRYYPFNLLLLGSNLAFIVRIASIFVFAIHFADTPREYMDSFYVLAVSSAIFITHLNTTLEINKLFAFIDKSFFESKLIHYI